MAKSSSKHVEGKDLSWLVRFWSRIFEILGAISIFKILTRLPVLRHRQRVFVEAYVFCNTCASIAALAIASYRSSLNSNWVLETAVVYASLRILEITIYQINVLLFDEYRAKRSGTAYAVNGFRRIVLLLIHNYFEVVCWFGLIYVWLYRDGRLALLTPDPTFVEMVRESMLLMFSFNAYKYQPSDDLAVLAFSLQALVGLFMTLMVLARFLSLLPAPKSVDELDN